MMIHGTTDGNLALLVFFSSPLQSIEYLTGVAGCRTVPVEVGSRYTDEEWSQTLLTFNEFVARHILNKVRGFLSCLFIFDT